MWICIHGGTDICSINQTDVYRVINIVEKRERCVGFLIAGVEWHQLKERPFSGDRQ